MALVTKNFTLNVTPGAMPPTIHVSEYDVGRTYTITLLDENGSTFEIPTGTTAAVEGTLNGTYGFTTSATISGNQISFALTESMTAYAGNAWCKIKLTLNSEPIQTCAFILAVDRAGVEAETVIGAPGFQEQINEGIAEYFDNDPPFFELPSGGQAGWALLNNGAGGAVWGPVQSGGGGGGGSVPSNITAVLRAIHGVLLKAMYTQNVSSSLAEILEMINSGGSGGGGGDDPTPSETVWQSGANLYVVSGVTASQSGSVLTIS